MRLLKITGFSRRKNGTRAMSLVELMIAVAAGTITLAVVGKLTMYTAQSLVALSNYNDLDQASVNTVDIMTRDVRQTRNLTYYATNRLVFLDYDGGQLEYVFNKNAGTLSRIKGTRTKILLRQCDDLRFAIYQRNPSTNFSFYTASTVSEAKLIDVNWKCSRQILRQKVNTESVQTARIVIRN